ncbi:MAG TPA: Ada metal-binding domain-containing protein [Methanobacterium sp.]|nr:Ada metal-binding domain-containing protein [Methanobacterium sp.]
MYIPPSEFNPYSWAGNTNYKTVSKSTTSNKNSVSSSGYYIGNLDSKKFHRPNCPSVDLIRENNKIRLNSRQEALNLGYVPCKNCNP